MIDRGNMDLKRFYRNKKVFITGHTGFKGSWLCLWLRSLGAEVAGYALKPHTEPSLYKLCRIDNDITSCIGDIRDLRHLSEKMLAFGPDIIFHLAAQPIVRESYKDPVSTYSINVMGTVHVLEAARHCRGLRAVVNVTTDKCYDNKEWIWGYRENDRLGGFDPYSNSKACSELVTDSFRKAFFSSVSGKHRSAGVASARAGNVIGGGDWAADRLIPDCVRAVVAGKKMIHIRNPRATRPWQHVLDCLSGYLMLGVRLYKDPTLFSGAWNFGPDDDDNREVARIVELFCKAWGRGLSFKKEDGANPHEAGLLRLDCSKAKNALGWRPLWNAEQAVNKVVEWSRAFKNGIDPRDTTIRQITEYTNDMVKACHE